MKKFTLKQLELLDFVQRNGQVEVEMCPRLVRQNKNFYERIRMLEYEGAFVVKRRDGASSLYTITNCGLDILSNHYKSKVNELMTNGC